MKKTEFLTALKRRISALPKDEVREHISFYGEMIDDRIDAGLSETEAVADIGNVDEIASQILHDREPTYAAHRERMTRERRGWNGTELLLIILGFPIWLPLLISAFAVVLSLYVTLWSLVVSLWAVFASLIACAVAGVIFGPVMLTVGNPATGLIIFGAALFSAGLAILLFFGCKAATVGTAALAKRLFTLIFNKTKRRAA